MPNSPQLDLQVLNGLQKENQIQVSQNSQIGSSSHCTIRLLGPEVHPLHASLNLTLGGRWRIRHLAGHHSQTLVNGTEIGEAPIQPGDLIQLGRLQIKIIDRNAKPEDSLNSKNPKWNNKLMQVPNISKAPHPILLLGPSGSGKDYLANQIHQHSLRKDEAFVSVNCAALNESLIESELFGHKKGSFTGAVNDRSGAFETANKGTLFLDEIGDLPFTSQAKLLRAIENKEIKPIGSDQLISTDARIIAATHKDLFALARDGQFRHDLLYRLNVIQIKVPTLEERLEDLPDLIRHFAKEAKVQLSDSALKILKKHSWPGNIREIKNFFARAQSLFPGSLILDEHIFSLIDPTDFSPPKSDSTKVTAVPFLKNLEREMIIERLKLNNWNQRRTAIELGIPKSTLNDRIKRYGLAKGQNY